MRILHTADWHLGKRLDHFSRLEEQAKILKEITTIANEKEVDVILIAGDLFDNFNPSNEALELYYNTLKDLTNQGTRPVFAIAGNHDSPDKINTTDVLARALGIFCFGHPHQILQNVPENEHFKILERAEDFTSIQIKKYDYPLQLIHTPYANEQRLKAIFETGEEDWALNKALETHWKNIAKTHCHPEGINILMTHLFMVGGKNMDELKEPEGERPLSLGNATLISSNIIPEEIQYVALGHLHKYIRWEEKNSQVVYSGSPLSYSFSEAMQEKEVVILDIKPQEEVKIERVKLTKGRKVRKLMAEGVEDAIEQLSAHPEDLIEIIIKTPTFLTQDELKLIKETHDFIIRLIPQPQHILKEQQHSLGNVAEQDIVSLFKAYFEAREEHSLNDELLDLFKEIIAEDDTH